MSDGVIEALEEWFMEDPSLEMSFQEFAAKHAHEFDDSEEHKLKHMDLYKDFCAMFESKLEDFITSKGFSIEQFMEAAKAAEAQGGHDAVNYILATADFDVFLQIMREAKPAA
mmetsp:Transcript_16446/g.38678  ORF Transcript_16446/g.38678 Transcript_16446/m.38678 type:complete len:113 (+) Transcript_16446:35-373(+)